MHVHEVNFALESVSDVDDSSITISNTAPLPLFRVIEEKLDTEYQYIAGVIVK